jgi:hypothetical protein
MKNLKSTLIYLAIAALLGGYIYFFERGPVKPKDEEKKEKVFDNFVADDIRDIVLENLGTTLNAKKTTIELKKNDKDVWQIIVPQAFEADEPTVRTMLSGVGDFNPDATIDNPTNLKDYGLDPPSARCTLRSKSGSSFVLLIGDKNMSNSSTYVKREDKNSVYLVASYAADNLTKGLNNYRNKTFFKTDTVLAQKVKITRDGKVFSVEKDKDNNWNITDPIKAPAEISKVRDLLNSISSLTIQDFENDHPSSLSRYGLSKPHIRIEVWSSDNKTPRSILIGHKKGTTTNLFASYSESSSIYLVGEYIDKTMDLKPNDYRDKKVMQFDGGAVKSLTVQHGEKTFVYQKDSKGQWSSPGRTDANGEGTALVNQLSGITISDFAEVGALTGLEQPTFIVDVTSADGTTRTYRFGTRDKGKVYLASDKTKDVYLVPDGVISIMEVYYNTVLTPVPATMVPTASK